MRDTRHPFFLPSGVSIFRRVSATRRLRDSVETANLRMCEMLPPLNVRSFLAWRISRWVIHVSSVCHGTGSEIYFEMMSRCDKCGNQSGVLEGVQPLRKRFGQIFPLKIGKWKEMGCTWSNRTEITVYRYFFSQLTFSLPLSRLSIAARAFKLRKSYAMFNNFWKVRCNLIILYHFEIVFAILLTDVKSIRKNLRGDEI